MHFAFPFFAVDASGVTSFKLEKSLLVFGRPAETSCFIYLKMSSSCLNCYNFYKYDLIQCIIPGSQIIFFPSTWKVSSHFCLVSVSKDMSVFSKFLSFLSSHVSFSSGWLQHFLFTLGFEKMGLGMVFVLSLTEIFGLVVHCFRPNLEKFQPNFLHQFFSSFSLFCQRLYLKALDHLIRFFRSLWIF